MKKALFLLTFLLSVLHGFSQINLKVNNSDYKNYYVNGSTNTYTITVVNLGPLTATNINVFNGIPSGVTNFNWTGPNGTSGVNSAVVDLVPSLAAGQVLTYIVNLTVPANFNGSLKSETIVTSTTPNTNITCDQCADIDTKAVNADIVVTNTDNKLYYAPGTSSVYTVKVTNNGPLDAANVKVSNPIPAGITQFSWTGPNGALGTNTPLNNTITLLKNGETATYTITLQVPAGYTGDLTSQTTVTSDTPDPNPCTGCTDTDTLLTGADVVVTNTDNKTTYTAGGTNTYAVKVENKGPQDATNVVVTNTLPVGIAAANVSWTGNGTSGAGFLNNTIATLAVGQSVTYNIVVQVPATFAGSLANQVSATSSTSDPDTVSNNVTDTDTQANATDIVVVNTDNTDVYTPGTLTTYTVTVTNNGPIAATAVAVKELVPVGIPAGNMTWTGSNGSSGSGNLNNTIATLAVKQTVTYTVKVNIPAGFTGNLTSTVSFTSTTADSDPTCTQCTDVDKIKSGVVVVNTDGQANYIAGQTRTYTVTVTNYDAVPATNVAIQDAVPAGINPATDVTWSGNGTTNKAGNLSDTILVLAPNQTVTYTIVVKIPSNFDQKTNLVNMASYSVNGVPNATVCAQCTDTDTPNPFADLQITKTDNQTQFYFNSTNTYTIVVSNSGPSDANNIVVQDKIPPGITVMTWSGSNGTSGTGTLNDIIPTLAVGQVVTYVVKINIGKSYSPPDPNNPSVPLVNLTNTVKVTSDTPDPVVACPLCSDVDSPRADYVTVDINKYTTKQLVTDILINSPCVNISNFGSTSNCGFGYFNANNSDFPIREGMIIRGGNAVSSQGKFDNTAISTVCSGVTDADLHAINVANGNNGTINDASSVKFDFVAGGDNFSFRYLFASNEYGTYQCSYTDAFAFILTDKATGVSHNLAVIPGTTTTTPAYDGVPVSVTSIRKNIINKSCPDANPTLFGQYNASPAAAIAASDINMMGQTVVLKASSKVTPGKTYTIKMVVGDYNDSAFDSAVFIEAGSFEIGGPKIEGPGGVNGSLEFCPGKTYVIHSGTSKQPGVVYSWKLNGVDIPGANDYQLTIDKPGVYTVVYTYTTGTGTAGCQQSDELDVVAANIPPLQEANDLNTCQGNTFDLSQNVPVVLGSYNPDDYNITYYKTQTDADNQDPAGQILNFTAYPGTEGETVYMSVEWLGAISNCVPVKTFKLHFTPAPAGTFQYVDDGGVPGFCRNSTTALAVTKSTPFTEGGVYSVSPTTGLTVDPATGTLDLTGAVPGNYVVNYKVAANGGCPEYNTTANVKINACVTVVMNPIPAICSGDAVVLTATDAGAGVVYTWSDASGVLGTSTVPNFTLSPAPTVPGSYVYTVIVSFGTENSAPSSQTLVVNVTPVASITGSGSICSGQSTVVTFSGTPEAFVTYNDGTSNTTIQLSTGSVGTYVLDTPILTANVTYKLVSVAANSTPNCLQNIPATAPNSVVTITVIEAPTATVSYGSAKSLCMGEATDVVFSGTPGAEVVYTKNGETQNITLNASGQDKIISTGVLNEDTTYTIVSVTSGAAACVGTGGSSITIDVIVIPEPALKQKGYICVDPATGDTTRTFKLDTALDPASYTFAWSFQEDGQAEVPLASTQSFYDADKVGQYKVVVTDNGPLHCKRTSIASVLKSVPPTGLVAEVVTGYFEDNATVVATAAPKPVEGTTYEYSLDFGPYQDSNEFKNVSYGPHMVHVRDKEACDTKDAPVTVINFPRYFTPNGDGYTDEWNIAVLSDQPNAKIYIFDRFGKLLKQINPSGAGWDGTYNGRPMPADDYWFVVKYQEQLIDKEFKAHFTLKR